MNIGNNISTLNLNIGTNLSSGVINIGSINKTTNISGSVISIADSGLSATGKLYIASGTNVAGSEIIMGSTTLTRNYIRGGDVNINHLTGGNTNIGNNTTGTTTILGSVNIANSGLPTGGGVNIATGTFGGDQSYITMGSSTFPQIYMRSAYTRINDVGGNTVIGNSGSGFTLINSNAINIGQFLTGTGYIDIGGQANTTTGYCVFGSTGMDSSYIRARNIYMNTESGNINMGSTTGNTAITCSGTLIAATGSNWPGGTLCTITSKGSPNRGDALGIQTLMDNGQYIISFYNNAGGVRAMIRGINSTTVEYATSSDRRLKKNIQPMDSMMENIMRMNPCSFGWITNEDIGYGFIAQEVYDIFPHLRQKHPSCKESCDDSPCDCSGNPVYYGLDYGQFTPYIVKAMQEMKISYDAKLQEQSEQITQLMARVSALESS